MVTAPTNTTTEAPDASTSMTPQPSVASSRPIAARSAASGRTGRSIYLIEGLSPYQNNWTVKARVTHKADIRTRSSRHREGKLFNVTLMDKTGEIRATAFKGRAYNKLEEGKVYYISKGRVATWRVQNMKYSGIASGVTVTSIINSTLMVQVVLHY
jgi:replication factor A1